MANFCSECGASAHGKDKFCHACGASLSGCSTRITSPLSTDQIMRRLEALSGEWLGLMLAMPIGLGIGVLLYSDYQQYLLTAAYMAPSALISYTVIYWLGKLMMRRFRLRFIVHLLLVALSCVFSPVVAVWFADRPIDLMAAPGKSFLIAAGCSLFVIGIAQEIVKEGSTVYRNDSNT